MPSTRVTETYSGRGSGLWIALGVLAVAATISGCAAVVLGGAAVGAAAIHDRRDYTDLLDDQEIELRAAAALSADKTLGGRSRIAVTSYNHKVLLTGQVETAAAAAHAANQVSRLPKVEQVVDEVTIGAPISLMRQSEDVLVTSRSKFALTKIRLPEFDPTRVKVVTEGGVVYLMGLVSYDEADAAAEQVRYVPGVKRVVKLFEYRET
jgi:osmotically-inducible protein OsmY